MESKKILIISNQYNISTSANGICMRNLAIEMQNQGHEVYVISDTFNQHDGYEEIDGIKVYKVYAAWSKRIHLTYQKSSSVIFKLVLRILAMLKNLLVLPVYPNVSPIRSRKVIKLAKKIVNDKDINVVIGAYRAYDTIKATMKLKKIFGKKIRAVTYHLDLILSPDNMNRIVRLYKQILGKIAIYQELRIIDRMILPTSAKGLWNENQKIAYTDFPLYLSESAYMKNEFRFPEDSINITFIGTLDDSNRNPLSALRTLQDLPKIEEKKVVFHFWGMIADKDLLNKINDVPNVFYHGVVENCYVRYLLQNSDFLLNISNKVTYEMIPSKIFQMFSIKRPIINIVQDARDASLEYFERYQFSVNVPINECSKYETQKQVENFIRKFYKKEIICDETKFYMSKPAYTVGLILEES